MLDIEGFTPGRGALDAIFSDNLADRARIRRKKDIWTVNLKKPKAFNRLVLQEDLHLGQRIAAFTVEARVEGQWETVAEETTVGFKRIVLLPDVTADAVRVRVDESLAKPYLCSIALYQDDIYHE